MKKFLILLTTIFLVGCNNTAKPSSSSNNEVISMSINERLGQGYEYEIPEVDSLTLSDVFQPGMVLQHSKPVRIYGVTVSGGAMEGTIYDQDKKVVQSIEMRANEDRSFVIEFDAIEPSLNQYEIVIKNNNEEIKLTDVLFGEVFVSAGQSNMEYVMDNIDGGPELINKANNPYIRFYNAMIWPFGWGVHNYPYNGQINVQGGSWIKGNVKSKLHNLSAISYVFAEELFKQLNKDGKEIPVAVLSVAVGGTHIESWLPRGAIDANIELKREMFNQNRYVTDVNWNKQGEYNHEQTGALYNIKIAPLANLNISGILWLQGESNFVDKQPSSYYKMAMSELISSYTSIFGRSEDNPVYFIYSHIAPMNYGPSYPDYLLPSFFQAFSDAWKENKEYSAQIPIYDLPLSWNSWDDPIHTNVKIPVGQRMALSAYNLMNRNGEYTAPTYHSHEVTENRIIVKFSNVGSGLKTINNTTDVYGFAICDSNRLFVEAKARIIDKDTVEVYSDYISNPVAVSYAYTTLPLSANLCNDIGFPAATFVSDKVTSKYYSSKDWTRGETLKVWSDKGLGQKYAQYVNVFEVKQNVTLSIDNEIYYRGSGSIKVSYTLDNKNTFYFGPKLDIPALDNQINNYNYLSFRILNVDNREKKLVGVRAFNLYFTLKDSDISSYTIKSSDEWQYVEIDLKRMIVNNEVTTSIKYFIDNATSLQLVFEDDQNGHLYVDDFNFH